MTSAAIPKDPALNIGTLSLNDCRTVCRSLKLRAAELTKVSKKLKELDRHGEAKALTDESRDIAERLGPKFDEQGTFNFGAGANEKKDKKDKGKKGAPMDLAEEARDRVRRGGR
jgi:hypothetical protein